MPSERERFWTYERYAVVGHSARHPFPRLTYRGLKARAKTVYAVDPSRKSIDGDTACADLGSLPGPVDALVLEVPKDESLSWLEQAARHGIRNIWIHKGKEPPELLDIVAREELKVLTGTCAVMYLMGGIHTLHRWYCQWQKTY